MKKKRKTKRQIDLEREIRNLKRRMKYAEKHGNIISPQAVQDAKDMVANSRITDTKLKNIRSIRGNKMYQNYGTYYVEEGNFYADINTGEIVRELTTNTEGEISEEEYYRKLQQGVSRERDKAKRKQHLQEYNDYFGSDYNTAFAYTSADKQAILNFEAQFDSFTHSAQPFIKRVLSNLESKYGEENVGKAIAKFCEEHGGMTITPYIAYSGEMLMEIADELADFITSDFDERNELDEMLFEIADEELSELDEYDFYASSNWRRSW